MISPLYVFFLNVDLASLSSFVAATCAGALAIASSTTVLAAIVAKAGGRGSLFTIISFPVVLPPLWIAIGATRASITGNAATEGVVFLLAFSGALIAVFIYAFRSHLDRRITPGGATDMLITRLVYISCQPPS